MSILKSIKTVPTREGAGVIVNRVFGYRNIPDFDPFLMLDYFDNDVKNVSSGFPWHPHRGIETITYLIDGHIVHEDSMGNKSDLKADEVQWMIAGKGVMHQEMIGNTTTRLKGFQFWVNMSAKSKMNAPTYMDISAKDIPEYKNEGVSVKVIAGQYMDFVGPIRNTEQSITLLHVSIGEGNEYEIELPKEKQGFIFLFEGEGQMGKESICKDHVYIIKPGKIRLSSSSGRMELIYADGIPLKEPIAWGGPIVMNTQEQLKEAFKEIQEGRFV